MTPALTLTYDGPLVVVMVFKDGSFTNPAIFTGARTPHGTATLLRHVAEHLDPGGDFEPVPQARGWRLWLFRVRRWWARRRR